MRDQERDDYSGRFQEKYPPEEVINAIRTIGGRATAAEVGEQIGSSRGSAYVKLRRMEEEGQVESLKTGGIRIWSIAEEADQEE